MKFKYLKGALKTHVGKIVEVRHMEQDYYTVKIELASPIHWNAGEFAQFIIEDKKLTGKNYRMFSVASIPSDGYLLIGFRSGKNVSNYKSFIINEGLNHQIKIRGPFGAFRFRDDLRPVVLYASGVGITPIMSLLKDVNNHKKRKINVVYAAANYYLFKEEIDKIVQANPNIDIIYTTEIEETQNALLKYANLYKNEAYYYNSGAPFVIDSVNKLLEENGISKKNLINDAFSGYLS